VKISLNLNQNDYATPEATREKAIERDVEACKRNDWEAKTRLVQTFMPLLTSLAKKRTQETATLNRYIEAGKEGLTDAARHFNQTSGTKFQLFALNYIEQAMNRVNRPGFFARLFGRT
jgi:DNA-directed RNA polymerase sigma subunit (sigma70/sigma32)